MEAAVKPPWAMNSPGPELLGCRPHTSISGILEPLFDKAYSNRLASLSFLPAKQQPANQAFASCFNHFSPDVSFPEAAGQCRVMHLPALFWATAATLASATRQRQPPVMILQASAPPPTTTAFSVSLPSFFVRTHGGTQPRRCQPPS